MPVATPYRRALLRRDVIANIPVLAEGEPFYATDTFELYVGSASNGNILIGGIYDPANDANWNGTPPSQVFNALDRLANAVATLLGGPIP